MLKEIIFDLYLLLSCFSYALSFYWSRNVSDQKFIYILRQSQTFFAKQKGDFHSVKFVLCQTFLTLFFTLTSPRTILLHSSVSTGWDGQNEILFQCPKHAHPGYYWVSHKDQSLKVWWKKNWQSYSRFFESNYS